MGLFSGIENLSKRGLLCETNIEFEKGDEQVVLCPSCGQRNLHQGRVEFWNGHDFTSGLGFKAVVEHDIVKVEADVKTSDSMWRRQLLRINFSCENCPARPVLFLGQHKGTTYMGWEE